MTEPEGEEAFFHFAVIRFNIAYCRSSHRPATCVCEICPHYAGRCPALTYLSLSGKSYQNNRLKLNTPKGLHMSAMGNTHRENGKQNIFRTAQACDLC